MLESKFKSDRKVHLFCEFLLYSLKADDLDVHKVNPEMVEAWSGVECNSLVWCASSGEKSIGFADC